MIRVTQQFRPLLFSTVATFGKPATARRMLLFSAAAILTIGDRRLSLVARTICLWAARTAVVAQRFTIR